MSERYENIPPEQKQTYLDNAEVAVREATDPVVEALGRVIVHEAEDIVDGQATLLGPASQAEHLLKVDAQAGQLADEAEAYAHDHDFGVGLNNGVHEEAEAILKENSDEKGQLQPKPTYSFDRSAINYLSKRQRAELAKLDKDQSES